MIPESHTTCHPTHVFEQRTDEQREQAQRVGGHQRARRATNAAKHLAWVRRDQDGRVTRTSDIVEVLCKWRGACSVKLTDSVSTTMLERASRASSILVASARSMAARQG